jgi:hypothetical protein
MSIRSWVIWIQSQPKGPFTRDEVLSLLATRAITRTQIAFEARGNLLAPDWKMLWQFPEFNTRSIETKNQTERFGEYSVQRSPISESERRERILQSLSDSALVSPPLKLISCAATAKTGGTLQDPFEREKAHGKILGGIVIAFFLLFLGFEAIQYRIQVDARKSAEATVPPSIHSFAAPAPW